MKSLLDIRDISFAYKDKIVIENISFAIHSRDVIAVIGPNGAGKTTLIKLMLGLLTPYSGTITRHISTREMGYVPQYIANDYNFPATVGEILDIRGRKRMHTRTPAHTDTSASDRVHIPAHASTSTHTPNPASDRTRTHDPSHDRVHIAAHTRAHDHTAAHTDSTANNNHTQGNAHTTDAHTTNAHTTNAHTTDARAAARATDAHTTNAHDRVHIPAHTRTHTRTHTHTHDRTHNHTPLRTADKDRTPARPRTKRTKRTTRYQDSAHITNIHYVIERLGLTNIVGQKFIACSVGQQQRVLIALALRRNPRLLILDEPTAGIDIQAKKQFYDLLAYLSTQGIAIILITHEISILPPFIRHVLCINNSVCCQGPLHQLPEMLPKIYGAHVIHHHNHPHA